MRVRICVIFAFRYKFSNFLEVFLIVEREILLKFLSSIFVDELARMIKKKDFINWSRNLSSYIDWRTTNLLNTEIWIMFEDLHYHQRQNNCYLYYTWSFVDSAASEVSFLLIFFLTIENSDFYIDTHRDFCLRRFDSRKSRWTWSQWFFFQNEYKNETWRNRFFWTRR